MLFQISFQEFRNNLLKPGLVDRIVVSNSIAKVYMKQSSPPDAGEIKRNASGYKFRIHIGSAKSFEEMLVRAQEALGIDPHDYVPVTYENSVKEAQIIELYFLLAALYIMTQRGLKGWDRVMKGGQGIFSFGKSKITKVDKNSKDKVSIL